MNYQLTANGFLPVSIKKENRLNYFDTLEEYEIHGNLNPFADMIAGLEEEIILDILKTYVKYKNIVKLNCI